LASDRRVLITGVAGRLAGLVARALESRDEVAEIVGVDVGDPRDDLERTRFVRADVRNPIVAEVRGSSRIDTVIHMATSSGPAAAGGRARMKELNVIGAMQLFAACQRTPSVRRVVVRSSTAVYGAEHTDPALFREDSTPRNPPQGGYGKDVREAVAYARALGRRRPDAEVTILRFANLAGGEIDGAFDALLSLPTVPTVLGYDPRLQFCHEEDAVEVLVRAATGAPAGIYNVAGDGVVYLSQCVRLAGRVPLPLPTPLVAGVASLLRRNGRADIAPDQLRFLRFGRVVDTSRLEQGFGYVPRHTSRQAFEELVARRRVRGLVDRDEMARWERELAGLLGLDGEAPARPTSGGRR